MSESYREQHPLLCDELSDEEHFSSQYQRRYRPMVYRGRARIHAKGATAIITQWPEHWTSSLTYWWAGLTMIAITIFAIYNCVIAFSLLPSTHSKATRLRTMSTFDSHLNGSVLPNVFMHLVVDLDEQVDLNKYLPYVEVLSNKYTEFTYKFMIIINDTVRSEFKPLTAEENNDIALNSLWSKQNVHENQKIKRNIHVEYVSLSEYMNNSPLKKYWKTVPHQFIEFLIKAISVWEKGGIAFNPTVLTSHSPNSIYAGKIQTLIQKCLKCREHSTDENQNKKHLSKPKEKIKKRVNNIRDIIDILEHDNNSSNSSQFSLAEAENINIPLTAHSGRKLLSTTLQLDENLTYVEPNDIKILSKAHLLPEVNGTSTWVDRQNVKIDVKNYELSDISETTNIQDGQTLAQSENNKTSRLSLLPLFLEFLFHDKSKNNVHKAKEDSSDDSSIRQRKSVISLDHLKRNQNNISMYTSNKTKTNYGEDYKPMIIATKGIKQENTEKLHEVIETMDCDHKNLLTIDLKGMILATETPCHAFIGSIFSNVIHHTEKETLNDFIIAELSIFCKGILSSCKGIDVILL